MTDEQAEAARLMSAYADGDAAAFHSLYRLLAPRLLGYLQSLARDPAAARDLLQQTMLKLHVSRAQYVRGADPIPWIYTMARRIFIDHTRRSAASVTRLTSDGELPPGGAAALDGTVHDAEAENADDDRAERTRQALDALGRLPENQREALVLTKLHGHSVARAAEITGTTPGAIKLRAHRAYVTLRARLGKGEAR